MNSTEELTSASAFALALASVRADVDRVLDELPEIRQEARRVITRELKFSPTPEQLQMIDSMAHGKAGEGPLQESLRSILALRLVATHALEELLNVPELGAERIRQAGELMPSLVTAVRYMEEGVRSGQDGLAPADRDCLLQTAQALLPSRDLLTTGAVLAPRLELLALAGKQDELITAVPQLTDEDVALVRSAVASGEDWTDGACRVCINALTLRTLIEDDLASWKMSRDVTQGDPLAPGTREWSLAGLERDRIAYAVLSEQLQLRQDTALVAGLREFADELSRVKGELFSSYLKLAPALRETSGPTDVASEDDTAPAPLDMESLLEECIQADKLAEAKQSGKVNTDEVYLNALRDLGGEAPVRTTVRQVRKRDVGREKRRLRVMVGIAVILGAIVVLQYGVRLRGAPEEDLRLDVTDFPGKVLLSEALAVGPMMYAETSHFAWDGLTDQQRMRRVEDLALLAGDRGFDKLWLTDENQVHLATWSKNDGTELIQIQ